MKQLFLTLLFTPLMFISCATDETIESSQQDEKMLESYAIKKNADGTYTLTHVVSQNVSTAYYDNEKLNEVDLYFDGKAVNRTYTHNYNVVNNELNIEFSSENSSKQSRIKIIDDNSSQKGTYGLLQDYTVFENADGSITLSYVVEPGVGVVYSYNVVDKTNDIKLEMNSNATQTSFIKVYNREADGSLKIDFVQTATSKEEDVDYKKPRLVFNE